MILRDGCAEGYDVHHIQSRGAGGADSVENMLCLCRKHHNLAHQGLITRERLRGMLTFFYGYTYKD